MPAMIFPSNPFATRFTRPDAFPFLWDNKPDSIDRDQFLNELAASLHAGQFGLLIGPHGSGKTTLLHALQPSLRELFPVIRSARMSAPDSPGHWTRLRSARRAAKKIGRAQAGLPRGGLLVVDGAEQLSRLSLSRVLFHARRRGQHLLATCHAPRAGMPILHRTQVDAELIQTLAQLLLEEAPAAVVETATRELCQRDLSRLSNVRDLWFELYDVVQTDMIQSDPSLARNAVDGRSSLCGDDSLAASVGQC